jgi:trimeric autotransporter adhesin
MTVVINGDTGISPVTASGTSASVDGMTVGRGGGELISNTAVGNSVLTATATGVANTGVGYAALYANTSGQFNTAVGASDGVGVYGPLRFNTTGGFNTGIGAGALGSNTTASNNTAVGYQAGYSNTTGDVTAFGYLALYANQTGGSLVAVGNNALTNCTTNNNTAVGASASRSVTTGAENSSFGTSALRATTTGASNVAIGNYSLYANTTASNNTAVGYQALYSNTTMNSNVAIGYQALYANNGANAYNSTAVGYQAGYSNTSGGYNTFIGQGAGLNSTTGLQNTYVGTNGPGYLMTTGSYNTILGAFSGNQGGLDIRTASSYIVLSDGNGNPRFSYDSATWNVPAYGSNQLVTSGIGGRQYSMTIRSQGTAGLYVENNDWGGPTGIQINTLGTGTSDIRNMRFYRAGTLVGDITSTNTSTSYNSGSDYRLKENIAPMTGALNKVLQLKPVTFNWRVDGSDGQGFIAHELQEIIPDAVTGKKDAVDEEGKPAFQGVDTSFLVATLTAAIQELKAEFDAYKATHP